MTLRLPDTGAPTGADGRRHAPSAERNSGPILGVLKRVFMPGERILEIASGTGQHAAALAPALGLRWQPTDVNPENLASIAAWTAGLSGVAPALVLDAAVPGWAAAHRGTCDGVLVVNLLHLVPMAAAQTVIREAALALGAGGRLAVYGPFLRDGRATSPGDASFDASLREQDPAIGYKDLGLVMQWMGGGGLGVQVVPMPANNLMLIAFKY